ncbi:MAG: phosphoglycerate mutase [Frondihabitans sp.]|nr:phosphoglycerate mutase [Frondihabitans sp.]
MSTQSTLERVPANQIHLVRHGEVFNPDGVLYGRIEGFGLSALGHRMAESAALALQAEAAPVKGLFASPLQRTQESAAPWARRFDLPIQTDERLIEPTNKFEGRRNSVKNTLTHPSEWPWIANPLKPSWGEAYVSIAARMLATVDAAWRSVDDGDVVLVSHQLPIWMVHRSLAGQRLFHDPRRRRCSLSSITTLERDGDAFVEVGYREPASALQASAVDRGAV